MTVTVALIGDRDPEVTAHRAIDASIVLAGPGIDACWIPTPEAAERSVGADAIWCVPASPYVDTEGALAAITHARTAGVPFLGTCGGYQHAIIEFARNVMNEPDATSVELTSDAIEPLISALPCALRDVADPVIPTPGSQLERIWAPGPHEPEFNCGFGLNPDREADVAVAGLSISARSTAGEARAVELTGHRFFVGVAFQPERQALSGSLHPVVASFLAAASQTG